MIVTGREQMRVPQQFDARGGNPERTAENKSADGVRRDDDGNEGEEGVVDESAAIYGNFVEAKEKGNERRQNCMQAEKWREGDENSN